MELRSITVETLAAFAQALRAEERCTETIKQYTRSVRQFAAWLAPETVAAGSAGGWKAELLRRGLSPATVNSKLAGLNPFFSFPGLDGLHGQATAAPAAAFPLPRPGAEPGRVRPPALRPPRGLGRERLGLRMEAICATGIRVSEVKYLTMEAARRGRAEVSLKGKIRTILIPGKLCRKLLQYGRAQKIASGEIFLTRSGRGISRKQVWAEMKAVCRKAGVADSKVFPHNLRHLFARAFYQASRDVVKLADVLGHSSIETTRIYLLSTGAEHARQLARLGLIS